MSPREPTEVAHTLVVAAPVARVWALLADTGRYAEWVQNCEEVTFHHGEAALGGVYKEVGHGLGPLHTHTSWTVAELDAPRYRRDVGTGMPLVTGLESIFELTPVVDAAGAERTRFTWRNRYRPALGRLGRALDGLQQEGLREMMRQSMDRLGHLATDAKMEDTP